VPGLQAHLSLLPPIQSPSPGPNRRLTQAQFQFHSHRTRAQTPTARGHAQENAMRSVGVHEDAASRANLLAAVIAGAVQTVDTLVICILWRWRWNLYSSCLHPIYTPPLCATSMELIHREHSDKKGGYTVIRVYRVGGKHHEHTASDAFVFIINATMSLMD